jgi:hypothetical protein
MIVAFWCSNMEETGYHDVEWNKPGTKSQTLHGVIVCGS